MLLFMKSSGSGYRTCTFKGGTLVTEKGQQRSDLRVERGRVVAVGDLKTDAEVVDASGLLILPGMVDTHVHLMDPGDTTREDFPTGTRAAAAKGVTTVIEHTHSDPIRKVVDLAEKRRHVDGRSNVDYALAAHVWPDRVSDLPDLWEAGIAFFKIFTCNTHGVPGLNSSSLFEAMAAIASFGGRCLVHNEDQALTADAEKRLKGDGRLDPALLVEWRSREAELAAVANTAVLALSTGVNATFAHVSNESVLEVVEAFRDIGADIAAEACPQYLALDENEVVDQGALRKFTPPARIRDESERKTMWEAVNRGRFSHFSTDHAPSTKEQKSEGGFWEAPFGLPGLDTTLPFLIDAALRGMIEISRVVKMYSREPARRYGLSKGSLDIGADADLVLVDPEGSWVVSDDSIISKAAWSPYSGRMFRGAIVSTFLRGEEIANGGVCDDRRMGKFIRPTV